MASAEGAAAGGDSARKSGDMFENNFLARGFAGGIVGAGAGALSGLLFGAIGGYPITARHLSTRQKIAYLAKEMKVRSVSDAKVFAKIGCIFGATECLVKKARGGRDDITNKAVAGCVAGGVVSAKGGPTKSCMGCAILSALVVTSELIFHRRN